MSKTCKILKSREINRASQNVGNKFNVDFAAPLKLRAVAQDISQWAYTIHFLSFQFQSNAHFSLLFHASYLECDLGFRRLLERGADPTWRNKSGNSVLKLQAKRGQISLAELAFKDVPRETMVELVNQKMTGGNWVSL